LNIVILPKAKSGNAQASLAKQGLRYPGQKEPLGACDG